MKCPHCQTYNPDHSAVLDDGCPPPMEGDISICIKCGEISIFKTGAKELRKANDHDIDQMVKNGLWKTVHKICRRIQNAKAILN